MSDAEIAVPAPSVASAPTAEELDRRHRDLFGMRSVVGAIAVVGVLCFFSIGLRAIDEHEKTAGFDAGSAYQVTPTVSFTPVTGWSIDKSNTVPDLVVTMTDNGVTLKVQSLTVQPGDTLQNLAKDFREGDEQSDVYAHVTGFETFATTSGAHGVTWTATGPNDEGQSWIVGLDDGSAAYLTVYGSSSNWSHVQPDLDAMAKSIVVKSAPAEGSTP